MAEDSSSMTTPDQSAALVPSQRARAAAANLQERQSAFEKGTHRLAKMMREGNFDSALLVQAFARFEQQVLAEARQLEVRADQEPDRGRVVDDEDGGHGVQPIGVR